MWFLRVWKIGQMERIATEQEKRPESTDAASAEAAAVYLTAKRSESSVSKRLLAWKKV